MKVLTILTIFLLSANIGASLKKAEYLQKTEGIKNRNEKTVYELLMSKHYFAAIPFALKHLKYAKKINNNFEKAMQLMITRTGPESFIDIPEKDLAKHKRPSVHFILGMKFFEQRNFKKASKYLSLIPDDNRFEPEAKLMNGSALSLQRKFVKAFTEYKRCFNIAGSFEGRQKKNKMKRYYAIIKESCLIHLARIKFSQKKYKDSILAYEKVAKRSYKWPYILIEKAWANYNLENYNRTLGLLVTYKYPLLKSYFLPETEILTALSYLKLCLWDDALKVIEQFYKVYRPTSKSLKSILTKNKHSNTYFLKLVQTPLVDLEKQNIFIRNLVIRIKKTIKYSLDMSAYKQAKAEIRRLKRRRKQTPFRRKMVRDIREIVLRREEALGFFIKKKMFDFINEIHQYSYDFFKIKIEIMANKRDLLYKNTKLVSNRSRGDFSNVKRESDQFFWEFRGSFWADELGDFSFGLKSNCDVKK